MTTFPKFFSTYFSCSSNKRTSTLDAKMIIVASQGDTIVYLTILLKNVLHVPKLSTNMTSIKNLTNNLSCNVIFHRSSCILQDKKSRRTIGHVRDWNDLHYMGDLNQPIMSHSCMTESSIHDQEKIQLHHYCLGRPSFLCNKMLASFFVQGFWIWTCIIFIVRLVNWQNTNVFHFLLLAIKYVIILFIWFIFMSESL